MKVTKTDITVQYEERDAVMTINAMITLLSLIMANIELTKLIKDSLTGDQRLYSILYNSLPKNLETGHVEQYTKESKVDPEKANILLVDFINYFGMNTEIIQNINTAFETIKVLSKYLSDTYQGNIYQENVNKFYTWIWSGFLVAVNERMMENEEKLAKEEEKVKEEKKK